MAYRDSCESSRALEPVNISAYQFFTTVAETYLLSTNLNRLNRPILVIFDLGEPDRPVTNVLAYIGRACQYNVNIAELSVPSISFQALRKSSGSLKAMKAYFA